MAGQVIEGEVRALAERVRASATSNDVPGLRRAYESVLAELRIAPGQAGFWQDGLDIVGATYERLLTGPQRRPAGQFFTPFWAGELMTSWLFAQKAQLLLDPGCGSGGLMIPAARHPRRGKTRLLGLDVDPLAIAMARANQRLRKMTRCELRTCNFLTDELAESADRVVCNPPYSRHSAVSQCERATIHDELRSAFGVKFSRRTSLQALFLLRALHLSSSDARLAFITPSDWLDVNYGLEVKQSLLDRAHVEALIFFDAEHLFFEGARTTAAITLIRKGTDTEATRVIRLGKELPEPHAVLAVLRGESSERSVMAEDVSLQAGFKWARPAPKRRRGVTLGDVARVHRGVATGANSYFCLSEEERVRRGIPATALRSCLPSPRHFESADITRQVLEGLPGGVRRWLVDCKDVDAESADTALGKYLRRGRRLKVRKGYLVSRRTPWYSQEQRPNAPIVFTYMNKDRPRFIRNRAQAVPLNNWLVIEPNHGVDADALFGALSTQRVREQLREQARVYGGGLWKLEPSELERITLPRLKSVTPTSQGSQC
ncbi:MAG: SAM-dependent methyltransferase [Actinomycetota bacterium]|nr:SAM-dependent methyltransferase [Actinomycetota bacterium]